MADGKPSDPINFKANLNSGAREQKQKITPHLSVQTSLNVLSRINNKHFGGSTKIQIFFSPTMSPHKDPPYVKLEPSLPETVLHWIGKIYVPSPRNFVHMQTILTGLGNNLQVTSALLRGLSGNTPS